MPLISVLLPFYNCEGTLASAIESIVSQSMGAFELLLANDGSTDRSASIAEAYAAKDRRVRFIDAGENLGLVARLNEVIDVATGDLIARMDGDDVSHANRFALQAAYLDKHQDVVAVSAAHKTVDGRGAVVELHRPEYEIEADPYEVPARQPHLPHTLLMVRTRAVRQVGGYRHVLHAEDADLYWRLNAIGKLRNLPDELGLYRLHEHSVSSRSLANARIQAVYSQLAAVSAQRRQRNRTDLQFTSTLAKAAVENAGSLESLTTFMARESSLDETETRFLAVASVAKFYQNSAWRRLRIDPDEMPWADSTLRAGLSSFRDWGSHRNIRRAYKHAFRCLWRTNRRAQALVCLTTYLRLKSRLGIRPSRRAGKSDHIE